MRGIAVPKEVEVEVEVAVLLQDVLESGKAHKTRNSAHTENTNGVYRACIIGSNSVAFRLADELTEHSSPDVQFLGFYDSFVDMSGPDGLKAPSKVAGSDSDAISAAREGIINIVYITLPLREEIRIRKLLTGLSDTTATVHIVSDLFSETTLHTRRKTVGSTNLLSLHDTPIQGPNILLKRTEDVLLSGLILTLVMPLMLCIAAAIKCTSKGPILFKQRRNGLDGKIIPVWKFRSMTSTENGTDVRQASRNDPRVTTIGRFLRRTSLDELPQFFNVLQGHMSIVGPRPHAVAHNEEYRAQINGYMLRHKVKPGITGWAQINGFRGETDTLEKMQGRIALDLEYIRNWSVWLDLKIILLTLVKGFSGKNAY
ncbi:undecaprenyl-phosphate glucose phosphotransferase [Biformimicrobium ophioploci]|uniref:Bacterial sugar transferase domain-containing protein n=1 Tax=Biformimicrobium ophioploci TaxID=3036711 RepID=A0ABQ6M0D2_9GAMM|nr:undecaprenyl-phosphate glucose phosphotransferase [Microbulbifer sp. NKW57]GMG87742.1 hypothetical protein MNKW57_20630 [Microbulbifer sp. NKW57]